VSAADTTPALSPIFRESALRRFEKPEHQATVRAWDQILKDLMVEGDAVLQGGIAPREHWRLDAAGALGDLMQAQAELAMVASLMEDSGLGEDGARLLVALADAAAAVEPIVAGLEAAIARFVAGVAL
jgi:hypothetical protein